MASGNRKAKRREIHVSFIFWAADNKERLGEGVKVATKDISAGGLSFSLTEAYPIGTELNIDLYLPKIVKPISVKIKVVRIEAARGSTDFLIGTFFVDLSMEDRLVIEAMVGKIDLGILLKSIIDGGASDLHLTVGRPPMVRCKGRIMPMALEKVESGEIEAMLYPLLTEKQIHDFNDKKELDFSFSPDISMRFRVNMHWQKNQIEATMRVVPTEIKSLEALELPSKIIKKICNSEGGLVVISGGVGAGKTTTLCAMVEYINTTDAKVIITLEDPIEYVFNQKRSIIKQREIGSDTESYTEALSRSLRQDPDVICIGELRDEECLFAAIRAAETGYLVIVTTHATDVSGTLERLVGFASQEKKELAANLLASSLSTIIFQKLIPKKNGGRIVATEILLNNYAVANLIKQQKFSQLPNAMLSGQTQGMCPLQVSLEHLLERGLIEQDVFEQNQKTQKYG